LKKIAKITSAEEDVSHYILHPFDYNNMRDTFHRGYMGSCKDNKDTLHIHRDYLEDNQLMAMMTIFAAFHFDFQLIFEKLNILNSLKFIHSMLI